MKRAIRRSISTYLAAAMVLTAPPVWPGEFHAVISNFGNAPRASAYVDVAFDARALAGSPVDVLFDVFSADGSLLAEFAVAANANGFASSGSAPAPYRNLFLLSGGDAALVRARIPAGVVGGTATLHQRGTGSRLLVSVPQDRKSDGTPVHVGRNFTLHVGDLRGVARATILVANVSGGDVAADIFVGMDAGSFLRYSTPRIENRVTWRVDLQPDDENANLLLRSNGDVIVQLVIDDGRLNAVTVLPTVG